MIKKKFYDRKKNIWYDSNRIVLSIQMGNMTTEDFERLEVFLYGDDKEFFNVRNITKEYNELYAELNRKYYKTK